jgi:hypothetical protein
MFKVILMVVAAGLMMVSTPTFAGNCGGHCQQMKVCVAQVTAKHLPQKDQQHAEYTKCMADPHSYK